MKISKEYFIYYESSPFLYLTNRKVAQCPFFLTLKSVRRNKANIFNAAGGVIKIYKSITKDIDFVPWQREENKRAIIKKLCIR